MSRRFINSGLKSVTRSWLPRQAASMQDGGARFGAHQLVAVEHDVGVISSNVASDVGDVGSVGGTSHLVWLEVVAVADEVHGERAHPATSLLTKCLRGQCGHDAGVEAAG